MFKHSLLIALALVWALPNTVAAQAPTGPPEDDESWTNYFDWAWQQGKAHPFIEASVGVVQPERKGFEATFADMGMAELKLGYSNIVPLKSFIVSMDERYLFGSYASPEIGDFDVDADAVGTKYARFGFGNRLGYGYRIGPFDLLPYNQNALVWTKLNFTRPDDLSESDASILDRYDDSYRFGQLFEAGLKFNLLKSLALTGGFEGAVVFPRTVFWYWFGSAVLQYGASAAVTSFSHSIVNASPIFGPIMYFLLKNGISYLFYSQMKDKMNWPFDTETPITMETIKLGAAITF